MAKLTKDSAKKIQKNLMQWYRQNNRDLPWRETTDPYRVWISEVMLQQTRIEAVIPYFLRFMKTFPTVNHLAESDLQTVLKLWEGLGYYARARNMHRAAKLICDQYQGRLPSTQSALLQLPGIGDYISAAIASISFSLPAAVVDGNVKRILARIALDPAPINDTATKKHFQSLAEMLLSHEHPGDFNQAVMELGQKLCRPRNPLCTKCPVQKYCGAFRTGQADNYPKKKIKKPVPLKQMAYAVINREDRWLLVKRPSTGMLGGLWEMPGSEIHPESSPDKQLQKNLLQTTGLRCRVDRYIGNASHAYTHFKVTAAVYQCWYMSGEIRLNGPAEALWVRPDEIAGFPCHKLMHKILDRIRSVSGEKKF